MIEFVSRLPAGYQEVEYIQSSGTQYINTAYALKSEKQRFVCRFLYTNITTKGLCGAQIRTTGQCDIIPWGNSATSITVFAGNTESLGSVSTTANTIYDVDITVNNGTSSGTFGGTNITGSYRTSIITNLPIYLFTINYSGSAHPNGSISGRIYLCRIYDNDTLVRDFVPCYRKADNIAGLYDLVNGVFYGNAGSGAFAVGADVSGGLAVMPGGIIPQKYALRRRILASGGIQAQPNLTIQLLGTFYYNEKSYAAVMVGGNKYDVPQTITVTSGSVITLIVQPGVFFNSSTKDAQIVVNNEIKAIDKGTLQLLTYDYTVNEDCVIESAVLAEAMSGNKTFALRLTT